MRTITIDIINEKALKLLQDLELLQLIKMRGETDKPSVINWSERYKGAMTSQSITDIDNQLNEIRSSWE